MADIHQFPTHHTPPGRTNIGVRLNALGRARENLRVLVDKGSADAYIKVRTALMHDTLHAFFIQLVADVKKLEDQLKVFETTTDQTVTKEDHR